MLESDDAAVDHAGQLSMILEQTVIDRTGLTGKYKSRMECTDTARPPGQRIAAAPGTPVWGNGAPSIYTAIQEQLGLKLDASTAWVTIIEVDYAGEPIAH